MHGQQTIKGQLDINTNFRQRKKKIVEPSGSGFIFVWLVAKRTFIT